MFGSLPIRKFDRMLPTVGRPHATIIGFPRRQNDSLASLVTSLKSSNKETVLLMLVVETAGIQFALSGNDIAGIKHDQ
jgi:hypothetical protein